MNSLFSLLLSFLIVSPAMALEVVTTGSYRNFPQGNTIEVAATHEFVLWDQTADGAKWKLGFIQPKALVGAHGVFEAGVSVVPVGPLEITYSESLTSRWYDSSVFDCEQEICGGIAKRQQWKIRLGLAYKDFFAIPLYSVTKTRHDDKSKPFSDEVEYMNALPGGEDLEVYNLLTGLKIESNTYGIYARQARFKTSDVMSEAQYLFYRKEFAPWRAAVGVGRYDSSFSAPGFSIYVNLDWIWGNSLALF